VNGARRDGQPIALTVLLAPAAGAPPLAGAVVTERAAPWLGEGESVRVALEAGRLGLWEWDVESAGVRWSHSLEAIIHPDDRATVMAAIAETLERRTDHRVEYRIIRPDGEVRWVEGRGQMVAGGGGRGPRPPGVCMDITERKAGERELDDRRREAEVVAELVRSISASL